jgi:hypothetical protein
MTEVLTTVVDNLTYPMPHSVAWRHRAEVKSAFVTPECKFTANKATYNGCVWGSRPFLMPLKHWDDAGIL